MRTLFTTTIAVLAAATLVACSSTGGGYGSAPEVEIRTGVIEQVDATEVKSTHDQGVGAILGGAGIAVTQPPNPALATGMRVYIEGTCPDARVVPTA